LLLFLSLFSPYTRLEREVNSSSFFSPPSPSSIFVSLPFLSSYLSSPFPVNSCGERY
jgi:hypothetical protein